MAQPARDVQAVPFQQDSTNRYTTRERTIPRPRQTSESGDLPMSQTKLEFLNMMMNDPGMRQRNGNAQDRRRACEALWDEKQAALPDAEPDPEPEPEPEVVTEAETPDPVEDDDAEADDDSEQAPDQDDAPAA